MPHPGRRSRTLGALHAAVACIVGLTGPALHAASAQSDDSPQNQPQATPPEAPDASSSPGETPSPQRQIDDARAVLKNPQATADERKAAARTLLLSDASGVRAMLHRDVIDDDPPGVRRAIAEAVATLDDPPTSIEPALASSVESASPEELAWLLPALRTYQSRATVGSLISLLSRTPPLPDATLSEVYRTLTDETGQTLPSRPGPWLEWWSAHEHDRSADWYRAIAASQAQRARTTTTDRDRLTTDVERLYREVHALTPVGERSPLIAELIRSDRRLFASIGFDLARRALLNARPLGPEVVEAAAARLQDPDTTIRRDAASLLDRIDPPDIGPRAAAALRDETDPETAAALLRIISRQPEAGANQAAVRWVGAPGPARAAALGAGVALLNKGYLQDPASIDEIQRVALEEIDAGTPSVAGVRFLAATHHLAPCVALLNTDNREVAVVAAEALAASPELYPRLIESARTHPDLYPAAATAIRLHQPTAAGLRTLLALPAPADPDQLKAATRVAAALPPSDLLDVAKTLDTKPALLTACLANVPTVEFMTRPDDAPARQQLLQLYLRSRLAQRDPDAVIQALTAIQDQVDTTPFAAQRTTALLLLGRLDDAERIAGASDVPVTVWLDALRDSIKQPFAAPLAERIRTRFKDALTPEQLSSLNQLVAQIAAPPIDATANDPAPAPSGTPGAQSGGSPGALSGADG